ncbi:MAG: corrinoid protein [Cyclobacteriaceae bacterium]|nr:corrinoid protein [Cyclobacteriaceae bacterium]
MKQLLYKGNAPALKQMTEEALEKGITPEEILNEALIAGMAIVGQDFKANILYVPEVLIAARAMKTAMAVLKPLLSEKNQKSKKGLILMGTVKGDLHDIGKNLVSMMAEGVGFDVIDIGVDQSTENFVQAVKAHQPDVVGMSALLTTTMYHMKTVIEQLKTEGLSDVKVAVGGAPISKRFAIEIGADGYAKDAYAAVGLFEQLTRP